MRLEKLSEILERARERESRRLVVAAAEDLNVLQAVLRAKSENIIKPLLVGDTSKILAICREHQLDLEDMEAMQEKRISS